MDNEERINQLQLISDRADELISALSEAQDLADSGASCTESDEREQQLDDIHSLQGAVSYLEEIGEGVLADISETVRSLNK